MGAKIGKLINDDSDVKELDDWDPELGEDDDTSATWDSSSSSDGETADNDDFCTPTHDIGYSNDPYYVEKRMVAGSNQFVYNIVKRK
ncbi:Protein kinase domain-containing protein [Caenorhabditis elegans]|uniref:Protein kinase domain-containing protein n=1 Tax=Caenorhabditis elegans TaxID=6239 RepID=Q9XW64_CAEEL|nr:Protein kinase domain-containing protein [Caenorhabditis elegans]CAA22107.1 Protein kinase domain-containing protein [Caenorhabditis elegans]|eukprot:NP_499595.1 Uncharacterized protein CELE_Y75B8A.23 [Caenorhabditis elegans]